MSIDDELKKIKELEQQIKQHEKNILIEAGIIDNETWLDRNHMRHKINLQEILADIETIQKDGYTFFKLKESTVPMWSITK